MKNQKTSNENNLIRLYEEYFLLFFIHRIHEYKKIDEFKKLNKGEARSKYKRIQEFYLEELNIDNEKLKEIERHFEQFKKLHTKYFNEDRKELFNNPNEFLKWYKKQNESCN